MDIQTLVDPLKVYSEDLRSTPEIRREEQTQLALRYKRGDLEAGKKLVICNLRYVKKRAQEMAGSGINTIDLILAGNLGLLKARERYDPDRGGFLNYAHQWIRREMIYYIRKFRRQVYGPLAQSPKDWPDQIKSYHNGETIDVNTISILVEDQDRDMPLSLADVYWAMDNLLSSREYEVMHQRYLNGQVTLEQIAKRFQCTRENVRLIERSAINKIRRHLGLGPLKHVTRKQLRKSA